MKMKSIYKKVIAAFCAATMMDIVTVSNVGALSATEIIFFSIEKCSQILNKFSERFGEDIGCKIGSSIVSKLHKIVLIENINDDKILSTLNKDMQKTYEDLCELENKIENGSIQGCLQSITKISEKLRFIPEKVREIININSELNLYRDALKKYKDTFGKDYKEVTEQIKRANWHLSHLKRDNLTSLDYYVNILKNAIPEVRNANELMLNYI